MPDNFIFDKQGPITTITFNRPERRNCLDEEVIFDFENLLHTVRDDRETRALIVTGTGTAFCAGADVSALKASAGREQQRLFSKQAGKRMPRLIGRVFDVLANLDVVTIGAINGYAVGGGWSWALAFDFCLAVEDAEFWVPEVDMGVPYRGAPAKVLAAALGPWRAKEERCSLSIRALGPSSPAAFHTPDRSTPAHEWWPAFHRIRCRWCRPESRPTGRAHPAS